MNEKAKPTITEFFLEKVNNTYDKNGQHLIYNFFLIFSRFECALKESGYHNRSETKLQPDWDGFIISIRENFNPFTNQILEEAVNYLKNNPPKVQIFSDGNLEWKPRVGDINQPLINKLSLSIRDVRNNLFHGGKFNGNYKEDESRNYILLKSVIVVLQEWLSLNDTVKENFKNDI
ncbi:hypothetical protein ASG22_19645 [Chryseobacterium sp. Leaf405]|uniref:hypothetical protein n=1 Tax=Chryseobacterium sp. Leaf405 TaxID=1736367 RepID=UPI0006FFBD7E|nr:hypothetical protein [Chryseobacterium sp. Leaf405]KQT30911.1 hypothetical protein ASG22_19645 [Chryseobacterium sp. Leaf405]